MPSETRKIALGRDTQEELLPRLPGAGGAVRLLTYPDGAMDVFCPAGVDFAAGLAQAKAVLSRRGLQVGSAEVAVEFGTYLPVAPPLPDNLTLGQDQAGLRILAGAPFDGFDALVAMALRDCRTPLTMRTGSHPR